MLISEFARTTGLSNDTVRFYVRLGLIEPATGTKGGGNPYQLFTADHVEIARMIRMAQALGFSLKEIAALGQEHRSGKMTRERSLEIMVQQLARLEEKSRHLDAMARYLPRWCGCGTMPAGRSPNSPIMPMPRRPDL